MLGIGIGPAFRRKASSTYQGPLDLVSGASAAYSLRKLRSAYSGSAIRVRRSSDNAELDIGFASGGGLDMAALLAHCGAGSGFVAKWYDQSGNGYDAAQTTAANQPRIVNSGALEVANSKASINFIALSSTRLVLSGSGLSLFNNISGCSALAAWQPTSSVSNRTLLYASRSDNTAATRLSVQKSDANKLNVSGRIADSGSFSSVTSSASISSVLNQTSVIANYLSTSVNLYINGVLDGSSGSFGGTPGSTDATDSMVVNIGALATTSELMNGCISELLVFQSALSTTNRQTLEANQKSYYGTP